MLFSYILYMQFSSWLEQFEFTLCINFLCNYRKKKLTDHWRNFIRPLMWRCKWTELRIKEIESQALKYSKELAEFDQRKCMGPDPLTLEEIGSKSLPFSSHQYRSKAKKRRKRKKVEDTTDIGSYMSHHYLFSYLGTNFFALIFSDFHIFSYWLPTFPHFRKVYDFFSLPYIVENKKSDPDGSLADDFGNPG